MALSEIYIKPKVHKSPLGFLSKILGPLGTIGGAVVGSLIAPGAGTAAGAAAGTAAASGGAAAGALGGAEVGGMIGGNTGALLSLGDNSRVEERKRVALLSNQPGAQREILSGGMEALRSLDLDEKYKQQVNDYFNQAMQRIGGM